MRDIVSVVSGIGASDSMLAMSATSDPAQPAAIEEPRPVAGRDDSVFAALKLHDFRLLLITQVASGFRGPMFFITQAWYVNTAAPDDQRVLLLGALGAIRGVTFLSFVLFGGAIADRFPRRAALIVSHVIAAAMAVGVATLFFRPEVKAGEGPWLAVMFVLFASFGLINGQDQPTRTAMIRDVVPQHLLTSSITLWQFAQSMALLPAALFAGLLIEGIGFGWTYLIATSGHLVTIGAAFALRTRLGAADPDAGGESMLANLRGGLAVMRGDAIVRWTILLNWSATAVGLSVMGILIAAWVEDILGLDAFGWGLMMVFWALGGMTGSVWLASRGDYHRMGATYLGVAMTLGAAVLGFSLSRHVAPAFLFNGLAGFGHAMVLTVSTAIIQRSVPNRVLGRVTGLLLLSGGLMQVAGLGVGLLAQEIGLEPVYTAAGLVIIAATLATAIWQPALRRLD
jgi:MFS family permease